MSGRRRIRVTARGFGADVKGAAIVEEWLNHVDRRPIRLRVAQCAAAWKILGYDPYAMLELGNVLDILKARESQLERASLGV